MSFKSRLPKYLMQFDAAMHSAELWAVDAKLYFAIFKRGVTWIVMPFANLADFNAYVHHGLVIVYFSNTIK